MTDHGPIIPPLVVPGPPSRRPLGNGATEVQPPRADATVTALYRLHLIINADGFENPRSYRTEERAATFELAWAAGLASLRKYAAQERWTGMQVISYGSCERVPGTENGPGDAHPRGR